MNTAAQPCKCGFTGFTDIHTHIVPESFPAYAGRHAGAPWPSMAPAQACHRHVMISGSIYRTVSEGCWSTSTRLADMDANRIDRQVLSPMPELLSYWLEPDDGAAMCRFLNESIAGMVAQAPQRFVGLGAVPLQDVERAIRELDHAVNVLGLAGVEIGGNINETVIGAPSLAPFFEAAERWGAAIFVHALRPVGMNRLIGPPILEQTLAFPGEVGLAAASLITGGTLARFPRLRIAFSHGGGSLAMLLPRLQHAWSAFEALRKTVALEPARAARTMYYDNLVYDAATIRHLIHLFGETQLMAGSDYPFAIMDPDPRARIASLELSESTQALLTSGNAQRWLFGPETAPASGDPSKESP